MGFKDLHLFNISLLGKQLWRLLSAPGSLLYRTLRAKYFPDEDLLLASAPARSSFAWKGLHHAMSHLQDRFYWTLGIDSQVRLYRDRWGGFSPITLARGSSDNEEVPLRCREFMLPGQACWDHSKLSTRLSPEDVDSILEVPISSDRADTLIWEIMTLILAKLPAVPKVRSFGWRCGRDALPVGSRLRDAGLSDGACQLCGFGLEDTLHAIRDCSDASSALRQAGFADTLLSAGQTTTSTWLDFAASSLSLVRWPCSSPSSGVSGGVGIHGCMSALSIPCILSLRTPYRSVMIIRRRLLPPMPPTVAAALPLLARDSFGAVLGGFARPVPVLGLASAMEAFALFAGLEFSKASGWASAVVESDAAVLINKLHRPTPDLSLLGDLLVPSRNLIAASRGCLQFGFAPRSANSAAHALASWASQNNDVLSFSSVCPELISRVVLDDLSSSF
ncbi:hypothetical protein GQ457_05G022090 [Hibiscus cannabinus]